MRKSSGESKEKSARHHVLPIVFATTALAVMGVSSITPVFPVVRKILDLTPGKVGLLITVFTLPGVILTPLYGILIDRVHHRKILIPVLFLYGIAGCLVPVCSDFRLMLLFRVIQGVGNAPLTTLSLTMISDAFSGQRRNSIMGYNAAVLSIATALFPAVGGGLAAISWKAPFFLPFLAVILGFLSLTLVPDTSPERLNSTREYLQKALDGMKNSYIITLYICAFLVFCILFGSFLTYFTFFLSDRFSLDSTAIGLTITFMSLATAVVSMSLGRLLKRFSFSAMIITAFILYGLSMVAVPFVSRLQLVYVFIFFFGLAQGLAIPLIQILITRYAPNDQKAVFLSFYSVVMNGGAALGPVLAGVFFRFAGYTGSFSMAAVLAGLGLILYVAFAGRTGYNTTRA